MKNLNVKKKLNINGCLNFRHLSLIIIASFIACSAYSFDKKHETARTPATAFDEEVLTVPLEQKVFIQSVFAEDDAGVMKGVRDSLSSWNDTEEYAHKWDLESTLLYKTPTTKEKKAYITSNILKYADKRLAGEMKNAEAGSTLHAVGNVEKSLRVNASVPVSKYISFKFKARVLQGKVFMDVKNPWIECNTTVNVRGKMRILTKKDITELGTSTGVEYNVNESQWLAFADQEITKNIKARISSTSIANSSDADKKVEMIANFPLNF